MENLPAEDAEERSLIGELRGLLSRQRRQETVSKGELVFVDI